MALPPVVIGLRLLSLASLLRGPVCVRLVQETTLPVVRLNSHDGLVVHDQHLLVVVAVARLDIKARAEVAHAASEDQVEARRGYLRPAPYPALDAVRRGPYLGTPVLG